MIPHKRKILMLAVILAAGTVAVQVINAQSGGKAQHGSMHSSWGAAAAASRLMPGILVTPPHRG